MTLSEASEGIGRKVIYTPFKECDPKRLDYGIITSVNDLYVFVRYGVAVSSTITNPNNLEFDV